MPNNTAAPISWSLEPFTRPGKFYKASLILGTTLGKQGPKLSSQSPSCWPRLGFARWGWEAGRRQQDCHRPGNGSPRSRQGLSVKPWRMAIIFWNSGLGPPQRQRRTCKMAPGEGSMQRRWPFLKMWLWSFSCWALLTLGSKSNQGVQGNSRAQGNPGWVRQAGVNNSKGGVCFMTENSGFLLKPWGPWCCAMSMSNLSLFSRGFPGVSRVFKGSRGFKSLHVGVVGCGASAATRQQCSPSRGSRVRPSWLTM